MNIKIISLLSLLITGGAMGWFLNGIQDTKEVSIETKTTPPEQQEVAVVANAADFVSIRPAVAALPEQTLSDEERSGLIFMREEEKLARDVYSVLYDKWELQFFSNIAQSEQTHTEAVRTILTKYNISDPVTDDTIGIFVNSDLQKLYADLTTRGLVSLEEALTVGAHIEDLDISDLQKQIALTDNDDIKLVYENLMRGSRNHLRAFTSQLTTRGETYTPKYITQSEFDTIIASEQETGSGRGNNGRSWGEDR
ncbi:MAG: DUF2202 domain-containing protein [Candidatus Paceibacteria bacterium]